MKKEYICPATRVHDVKIKSILQTVSIYGQVGNQKQLSKESDFWDDEEEVEDHNYWGLN